MSFVSGQRFAVRARILLPDNLYALYQDAPPTPTSPYSTVDDILAAADAHQPDLVFLLSGYLLEHGRLLSRESLDQLLRHLRDRGCHVITSDPFLGLAPTLTLGQIDARMFASGQRASRRLLTRLMLGLRRPETPVMSLPSLEDVTHLYPTGIPDAEGHVHRIAFFNPAIVSGAAEVHPKVDAPGPDAPPERPPRWLFVLSATDLQCQVALEGLRGFTRLLAGMLWHALGAGRWPTLIAPASIMNRLKRRLPNWVELLPGCPFREFERRLLDAEYVFYWNAFSFSQQARMANELPLFLFDRGHLARTIKPFYDIARACHFGGWEPPYLDQRQALSVDALAPLATAQQPALRAIHKRWAQSPIPDEVVDRLMRDPGLREPA